MTGCVDGPFGIVPRYDREISDVYWRSARRLAPAVAGSAAPAASMATAMEADYRHTDHVCSSGQKLMRFTRVRGIGFFS